tara:strand:+ start:914 stop:1123 length:210 start_codon:yes stop_codon:yes gene_type:complete
MKQSKYSEYTEHKAEHDEMREKISNIQNLHLGGTEVVHIIKGLLHLWVDNHKKTSDKKFGVYANSKGIT